MYLLYIFIFTFTALAFILVFKFRLICSRAHSTHIYNLFHPLSCLDIYCLYPHIPQPIYYGPIRGQCSLQLYLLIFLEFFQRNGNAQSNCEFIILVSN